ncbi:MAG TPA: hypothetical protein DIU35_07925 [Candidatus Latescibacteria bacterium]|nr:hypothetical protein [Gemmatimonadota bacterium]HCR17397.1 hypothetical protein [Candidatus Latescibacterota bacterium]
MAQGESPKYIQRQMRHASITTTFNVYGHLMPEVHQRAGKNWIRCCSARLCEGLLENG